MRAGGEEAGCYELLRRARWTNGPSCPFCQQRRVTMHTKLPGTPRQRYLCLACRRTFTDLTGTPFARTNLPLNIWFRCLQLMRGERRTSELAKALGVKWDTAASLQRRLTAALARPGWLRLLDDQGGRVGDE